MLTVSIDDELLQTILEGARHLYPRETIVLLRGRKKKDTISITELVIPPLADYGQGFSQIRLQMLPIDFSIVGTAHSHPSGNVSPSPADLNHYVGHILMIAGFPFKGQENVAVYDRRGEKLKLEVSTFKP